MHCPKIALNSVVKELALQKFKSNKQDITLSLIGFNTVFKVSGAFILRVDQICASLGAEYLVYAEKTPKLLASFSGIAGIGLLLIILSFVNGSVRQANTTGKSELGSWIVLKVETTEYSKNLNNFKN